MIKVFDKAMEYILEGGISLKLPDPTPTTYPYEHEE